MEKSEAILWIGSGLHAGAHCPATDGMTLGSALDCDVVLEEPGMPAFAGTLRLSDRHWHIGLANVDSATIGSANGGSANASPTLCWGQHQTVYGVQICVLKDKPQPLSSSPRLAKTRRNGAPSRRRPAILNGSIPSRIMMLFATLMLGAGGWTWASLRTDVNSFPLDDQAPLVSPMSALASITFPSSIAQSATSSIGLIERRNRPDQATPITSENERVPKSAAVYLPRPIRGFTPPPQGRTAARPIAGPDMPVTVAQIDALLSNFEGAWRVVERGHQRFGVQGVYLAYATWQTATAALALELPGIQIDTNDVVDHVQATAALRQRLDDADLAAVVLTWHGTNLQVRAPTLHDRQSLNLEQILLDFNQRFADVAERTDTRGQSHLRSATMPFLIRGVSQGASPYLLLPDGSPLLPGGRVGQYRLLEIHPDKVVFDRPIRLEVARRPGASS